jgi:uncharacterized protein YbjT (DUF2867 family)
MSTATTINPRILLTGATGFIGGTILTTLLASSSPLLKDNPISLLLRSQAAAEKLKSTYGTRVQTFLYKDLDDIEATIQIASQHDIVINTTLGYHEASAVALTKGLGIRRKETGRDCWILHTSGTSNLGDTPFSHSWKGEAEAAGAAGEEGEGVKVWDDAKDDVYAYEKIREAHHVYPQRTTGMSPCSSPTKPN